MMRHWTTMNSRTPSNSLQSVSVLCNARWITFSWTGDFLSLFESVQMFEPGQYELVDFGDGRKLERFGGYLLDRPCPAADPVQQETLAVWNSADARYRHTDGDRGRWSPAAALPDAWTITDGRITLELKPTECGHLGVFAEQSRNWDWIVRQIDRTDRQLDVLNLFAYTGGSTLAAAAAGARVVHVDSARNTVAWARRNAAHSGLSDAPIRWIVEDATKFVRREIRRGSRYDAVILDPPSYGHGPKKEVWKLSDHLVSLLDGCARLTSQSRTFLLLSCHSPGFGPSELEAYLADAVFGGCQAGATAETLYLEGSDGRKLPSGVVARWPAGV